MRGLCIEGDLLCIALQISINNRYQVESVIVLLWDTLWRSVLQSFY